ncbi:MAG: hypothetical protein AAF628_21395 [Planctomycetota bacterium]
MRTWSRAAMASFACAALLSHATAQSDFIHWETAHVHPLEMTPDGSRLLAVNTADGRLEIFDLSSGTPQHTASVAVGVDPVTVRALTNTRAWVCNRVSDTISVVDLPTATLVQTIHTGDEPSDLGFTNVAGGGTAGEAWVSCAQPNVVQRFDLNNLSAPPVTVPILGEDPTSMVVSPAGDEVYVAIRTSGNNTTILNGGNGLAPNIVSDGAGPYGGQNPPPNSGAAFVPPQNPANPTPPAVGLIVRKDTGGAWRDDNGGDWTPYVSGSLANSFGRIQNWDLYDHDIAVIDVSTNGVKYVTGIMNIMMGLAVLPGPTGHWVTAIGTEATNEIRFEPNIKSSFVRVMGAAVDPTNGTLIGAVDLNPTLVASGYSPPTQAQSVRDSSVGDPRDHVWDSAGIWGWVAGMGSNNVIRITTGGARLATIEVGSGPTGLALDEPRLQLYVLNKFGGSISVIDALNDTVTAEVPFFDPTPLAVKRGRKHLYDTHRTSGLGQVSCASCHVDGRIDNLAWDLGDPGGLMRTVHARNMDYFESIVIPTVAKEFHPMKGPMTTQTLQDIIGKEPFHWRGDRKGIEEFNGAFVGLLGDDAQLSGAEMQEFEDFLASIWFPPNPFRQKDNNLPASIDLSALNLHYHPPPAIGGPIVPLTTGDPRRGLDLFMPTAGVKQDGFHCVTCHVNPTGVGADFFWDPNAMMWTPIAAGAHGERHSMPVNADPNTQRPLKIPQLRNMHKKSGFDLATTRNTAGFGYVHDGQVDTISHFVSEAVFVHTPGNEAQDVADLAAFMLAYSGTGLPMGSVTTFDVPPGLPGLNSHAGVGFQWTVAQGVPLGPVDFAILNAMFVTQFASPSDVAIVIKQNQLAGGQRGFTHVGGLSFLADDGTLTDVLAILGTVATGTEATFTAVPGGTEVRLGIDRDADGFLDAIETALGTDPASARSTPPGGAACTIPAPAAPSAVAAAIVNAYEISVTWTDNSTNETGFAIERAWANSPQWEFVGEVGAGVVTYQDKSVGPNTGYLFRVRAFNCAGESATAAAPAVTTPILSSTVTCHVHAIDLQGEVGTGSSVRAYGTVQVVDDQGRNVKDAGVNVTITGPSTGNTFAVTNEHGQALFETNFTTSGPPSWTFTVQSIVSTPALTVIHDMGADVVTSATVP